MKKFLISSILILYLLGFLGFNINSVFASTCNTYGSTTYCSDGTSYNTYGNTTYGSDGSTYNTYGSTTYVNGPNGYIGSANTYGGTTYYNGSAGDNWTANTYGNTTYINGNNGTTGTINTYGDTSYGNVNTFNTCPTNSTANSSGKCLCNYGYSVNYNKTGCTYTGTIYTPPTYSNTPTYYPPTQSTCPLNSHTSVTDSTMCQCNIGYQTNLAKDACVFVPIKTNDQICQDNFGINVSSDGTKTSDGNLNCNCKTDYVWNSGRTACILAPTMYVQSKTETKITVPALSPKKEIETANMVKVEKRGTAVTQSNVGTEKKWYQKFFDWLF